MRDAQWSGFRPLVISLGYLSGVSADRTVDRGVRQGVSAWISGLPICSVLTESEWNGK